ncbi:copper chaperone [Fluviicoccus keumensis]|uniref:Copper chaperone n=1 Tax=Fluviicoccus keumensis TaxID=1435465 RepID=A0A4Q7YMY6_9GAMM|nr:heavy-metal-associated domain-containing protein [Fluviicoccus keumensis]RZU38344.1 copper chaperone [Fluviicoccus keumensis]
MIVFNVHDMTCGHCAGLINKAVHDIDPAARVEIDLTTHRVTIASATAEAGELRQAIQEAGYTPEVVS